MFPSTDFVSNRESDFPQVEWTLQVLLLMQQLYFHKKNYLNEDVTAMDPHMSLSHSNTGMCKFHLNTLNYKLDSSCLKSFRDEIFVLLNHSLRELNSGR